MTFVNENNQYIDCCFVLSDMVNAVLERLRKAKIPYRCKNGWDYEVPEKFRGKLIDLLQVISEELFEWSDRRLRQPERNVKHPLL